MIIRQILSVCVVIGLMAPMGVNSAPQTEPTPLLKIKAQDSAAPSKKDSKNITRFSWFQGGIILVGTVLLYGKLGGMWLSWRYRRAQRSAPPAVPTPEEIRLKTTQKFSELTKAVVPEDHPDFKALHEFVMANLDASNNQAFSIEAIKAVIGESLNPQGLKYSNTQALKTLFEELARYNRQAFTSIEDFFLTSDEKKALIEKRVAKHKQQLEEEKQAGLREAKKGKVRAIAATEMEKIDAIFKSDETDLLFIEQHQQLKDENIAYVVSRPHLKLHLGFVTTNLANTKPAFTFKVSDISKMPLPIQNVYNRLNIVYPPLSLEEQNSLMSLIELETKVSSDIYSLTDLDAIKAYTIDPKWQPTHGFMDLVKQRKYLNMNLFEKETKSKNEYAPIVSHMKVILEDPTRFNKSNISFITYFMYYVLTSSTQPQTHNEAVKKMSKLLLPITRQLINQDLIKLDYAKEVISYAYPPKAYPELTLALESK